MRIAIVNDTPSSIEAIKQVLGKISQCEIAWVALDGISAVEKCSKDTPDLILMDLGMPLMDGIEATRRIMQASPCAILIVTENVTVDTSKVFEAMGHGALDAVNTPFFDETDRIGGAEALLRKVTTVGKLIGMPIDRVRLRSAVGEVLPADKNLPPLVAIGSSTGGPQALSKVLGSLPADFRAAIVIIQHVDSKFADGLASWLDERCRISVKAAFEGCRPQAGTAWLAASKDHLVLTTDFTLHYTPHPRDCPFRPSADVFLKSAAQYWPRKAAGVLLTGMGKDGAAGLLAMRREGWHTIVQDQKTCVVYGMPKAAIELGAAVDVLPIDEIGPALVWLLKGGRPVLRIQRR